MTCEVTLIPMEVQKNTSILPLKLLFYKKLKRLLLGFMVKENLLQKKSTLKDLTDLNRLVNLLKPDIFITQSLMSILVSLIKSQKISNNNQERLNFYQMNNVMQSLRNLRQLKILSIRLREIDSPNNFSKTLNSLISRSIIQ